MKQLMKLTAIAIIAGIVLAGLLNIIQSLTGNHAYILLFNMDYIPLLKQWNNTYGAGMVFHFATCIASVIVLFYLLKPLQRSLTFLPYFLTYTIGGGILYSLTALTELPPALTDTTAWGIWTLGHGVYGIVIGLLMKYWK
ncbi:hypothetical protein [Virgibacillus siamensis]|uniref:hypothetical protein n=1 Tax=Virgibacillus siamensis TaxID=480071 RepID=UPI000986DD8B|nr:hypothetical protein [Virgibacillus siamensis]